MERDITRNVHVDKAKFIQEKANEDEINLKTERVFGPEMVNAYSQSRYLAVIMETDLSTLNAYLMWCTLSSWLGCSIDANVSQNEVVTGLTDLVMCEAANKIVSVILMK